MTKIRDEFKVHELNEEGFKRARFLADLFSQLLNSVESLAKCPIGADPAPGGREMALVRTHMQLASFYAKRAVAMHPAHQKSFRGQPQESPPVPDLTPEEVREIEALAGPVAEDNRSDYAALTEMLDRIGMSWGHGPQQLRDLTSHSIEIPGFRWRFRFNTSNGDLAGITQEPEPR